MSTADNLLLLVTLTVLIGQNLAIWPWGRRETTTFPTPTRTPGNYTRLEECPLRPCHYRRDGMVSFTCPISGCTAISDKIMSDVQDLRLQDNKISAIPILKFPHLQRLDLADNQISQIDDDAFRNLPNLTMLYLSNNKISLLKREYFRYLLNLKYLYLDQNRVTILDMDVFFPALTSIERIDLSTNNITMIDESTFVQLSTLKYLHLERNSITKISSDHLKQLPRLQELTLSQNKITSIQEGSFSDLKDLRVLDLGYNQIKHLPNASFCLNFPSVYRSHLQRLVLSNNLIDSIEYDAFRGLQSLQILHMPYNPIRDFPTFYLPPSLQEIGLHHMPELRMVPPRVFNSLTNLQRIEIYGNPKLSVISAGSFNTSFQRIKFLDLSRNNLQTLSENILQDWKAIPSVDLSGNPWHCDCKIRWMKEVYMNSVDRETIRCHSPHRFSGKSISSIPVDNFVCGDFEVLGISLRERTGILLIVISSIAFVSFLGLFLYKCRTAVFPCRYGQTSKYRALYNPKEDPEDDDIKITRTIAVSENERKILQQQAAGEAPDPVAL